MQSCNIKERCAVHIKQVYCSNCTHKADDVNNNTLTDKILSRIKTIILQYNTPIYSVVGFITIICIQRRSHSC